MYEISNSSHIRRAIDINASILRQKSEIARQDIEKAVRDGNLGGSGNLKVKVVLTAEGTDLNHIVEGDIELG